MKIVRPEQLSETHPVKLAGRPLPGTLHTFLLLACLYLMQGLPSGILSRALPALAREYGLAPRYIGLFSLLALPWVLKFLWAPVVDRWHHARLGHARAWIFAMQLSVMLCVTVMALQSPSVLFAEALWLLFALVLLINFFNATQDIASDGLAVRILKPDWRGLGNSMQAAGYKIGLMVGGGVLLVAMDVFGWRLSLLLGVGVLGLLMLPVIFFREPDDPYRPDHRKPIPGYLWHSLADFWMKKSMLLWLLLLVGYKIGDGFGTRMIKPMLIDRGWSLAEVGVLDLWSSAAGLIGVFMAGVLLMKLARVPALIVFGALQAASFLGWASVVDPAVADHWVWAVALFEQWADGLSTVVLFTLMMDHCRPGHEGGDYTQQSCVQLTAVGVFSVSSGFSAEWLGYAMHFQLAAVLGFIAIMPALFWRPQFSRV